MYNSTAEREKRTEETGDMGESRANDSAESESGQKRKIQSGRSLSKRIRALSLANPRGRPSGKNAAFLPDVPFHRVSSLIH
jgi:hypothetical protein